MCIYTRKKIILIFSSLLLLMLLFFFLYSGFSWATLWFGIVVLVQDHTLLHTSNYIPISDMVRWVWGTFSSEKMKKMYVINKLGVLLSNLFKRLFITKNSFSNFRFINHSDFFPLWFYLEMISLFLEYENIYGYYKISRCCIVDISSCELLTWLHKF